MHSNCNDSVISHAILYGMGLENFVENNVSHNYSLVWFCANFFLSVSWDLFFRISGCFRI